MKTREEVLFIREDGRLQKAYLMDRIDNVAMILPWDSGHEKLIRVGDLLQPLKAEGTK